VSDLSVPLPDDFVEQVAQRVAEILAPRFEAPAVPAYMTVKQACEYAGFTAQRIYDLRSAGTLSRHGDGTSVRVARAELDAYLVAKRP
jgi:excisionase family DNA binding protein